MVPETDQLRNPADANASLPRSAGSFWAEWSASLPLGGGRALLLLLLLLLLRRLAEGLLRVICWQACRWSPGFPPERDEADLDTARREVRLFLSVPLYDVGVFFFSVRSNSIVVIAGGHYLFIMSYQL